MSEERNSFTFYLSFEKAIAKLDDKNQLSVYRSISRYSLFGEVPEVDGLAAIAWELIKPILDKSRIRSENGRKARGIPKPNLVGNKNAENEANSKLNEAKTKLNEAKTKQDRDRDRDRKEDKSSFEIDIDVSASADKNRSDKPTRFVPPTLNEVQDYILKNGYSVDADRFVNFYEAKGWMIGKNKMKDWKAAVRTWQREQKKQKPDEIGMVLRDNSIDKFEKDRNNLW